MRKSGFTLSINPDKTQHYLSVALFAVKGRGQGCVLRGRVELSARGYQAPTIRTLFAHKPNQFNRQIVLKPSKGSQNIKPRHEVYFGPESCISASFASWTWIFVQMKWENVPLHLIVHVVSLVFFSTCIASPSSLWKKQSIKSSVYSQWN